MQEYLIGSDMTKLSDIRSQCTDKHRPARQRGRQIRQPAAQSGRSELRQRARSACFVPRAATIIIIAVIQGHLDISGDGKATVKREDGPLGEPPAALDL